MMADTTRSGFTEGKCQKCGARTFSKGRISKHRCHGRIKEKPNAEEPR